MKVVKATCDYILNVNNHNYKVYNEPFKIGYIATLKLNFYHRTIILN